VGVKLQCILNYNQRFFLLLFLPFLCGFFWSDLTWEEVNTRVEEKYPAVQSISTEDLKTRLSQKMPIVLIDAREKNEYRISHLSSAVNITAVSDVLYAKDTPIVVYCSVGLRSAEFARKLSASGYTNVFNLKGSIFEWANKGFPVVRGEKVVKKVHPYNKRWGKLLKAGFHEYEISKPHPNLVQ
jgi:rhodanese-related sulfurtransferase